MKSQVAPLLRFFAVRVEEQGELKFRQIPAQIALEYIERYKGGRRKAPADICLKFHILNKFFGIIFKTGHGSLGHKFRLFDCAK